LKKYVLKLSGPRALSDGKCLTTKSISVLSKGVSREDRSSVFCKRVGRLKSMPVKEVESPMFGVGN
jgi:hypothetical protein